MFAKLLRQWWPRRTSTAVEQMEFFATGDLPQMPEANFRSRIERAVESGNKGDVAVAVRELRSFCSATPGQALPNALLGALLERQGDMASAEQAYTQARRADAGVPLDQSVGEHFHRRGREYLRVRQSAEAVRCLLLAHRLLPREVGPLEMLGIAGYQSGDVSAGRAWLDLAIERASGAERSALRINRLIFTIPQIYRSVAEIDESRSRFESDLAELEADPPSLPDPSRAVDATLFFLCFQGRNDRELNTRFARMLQKSCPDLAYIAAHAANNPILAGRKPRIGFISALLREHSVGAWYRELVRVLILSGRFETALFTEGEVDQALKDAAGLHGRHVALADTIAAVRAQIEAERLDMLVYTDVAMNRLLYCLAFSRLAPVQALLVGHPCTSGVPTIDYFISNMFQDGENAGEHYSERLVRLPHIPVYVTKTSPPEQRLSRAQLGLAEDRRYYVCPMLLQKIHPDFDWAMARILRADGTGEILLFEDPRKPLWREELEARFGRALPDVARRIAFQPIAPKEVFLNILMAADCLLDPFHFSGGVTTHIELSLGLPVVTLPGELFRSRMTAGICAQAGVTDCIARDREHYVGLALALAADPALRAALSKKIIGAHDRIFETAQAVDELGDWMERTLSKPE